MHRPNVLLRKFKSDLRAWSGKVSAGSCPDQSKGVELASEGAVMQVGPGFSLDGIHGSVRIASCTRAIVIHSIAEDFSP
jgi:hypothetical protein